MVGKMNWKHKKQKKKKEKEEAETDYTNSILRHTETFNKLNFVIWIRVVHLSIYIFLTQVYIDNPWIWTRGPNEICWT